MHFAGFCAVSVKIYLWYLVQDLSIMGILTKVVALILASSIITFCAQSHYLNQL